jgi:hypothetical protein
VGELHADPGKGCVQIRFGEIGGEAANVHAKWGRWTLESHKDTITTTDAARFVPSVAMCLRKRPWLPSVWRHDAAFSTAWVVMTARHQSEAQQTMARRGAMVTLSIETAAWCRHAGRVGSRQHPEYERVEPTPTGGLSC